MSALHVLLAGRVLDHMRAEGMLAGQHLTEQSLEPVLRTSRSPIRGALAQLQAEGILTARPPRRGLFLVRDAAALPPHPAAEDAAYLALANDRLAGRLPAVLTENDAMRRYGLTRDRLRRLLGRAAEEGWIEQRASKGFSFLPMIDGPEACAESYTLRTALEPAAMLMPGFVADPAALARLRRQQQALADSACRDATAAELFQANSTFHETLARLSGNRFVHQVIARQNQLRRLLEYRVAADRDRVRRQCAEHLAILDLLDTGDRIAASARLRDHLHAAGADKVRQLTLIEDTAA